VNNGDDEKENIIKTDTCFPMDPKPELLQVVFCLRGFGGATIGFSISYTCQCEREGLFHTRVSLWNIASHAVPPAASDYHGNIDNRQKLQGLNPSISHAIKTDPTLTISVVSASGFDTSLELGSTNDRENYYRALPRSLQQLHLQSALAF
jgi:hypothetical protein